MKNIELFKSPYFEDELSIFFSVNIYRWLFNNPIFVGTNIGTTNELFDIFIIPI